MGKNTCGLRREDAQDGDAATQRHGKRRELERERWKHTATVAHTWIKPTRSYVASVFSSVSVSFRDNIPTVILGMPPAGIAHFIGSFGLPSHLGDAYSDGFMIGGCGTQSDLQYEMLCAFHATRSTPSWHVAVQYVSSCSES
jgi:hypothetical protein